MAEKWWLEYNRILTVLTHTKQLRQELRKFCSTFLKAF